MLIKKNMLYKKSVSILVLSFIGLLSLKGQNKEFLICFDFDSSKVDRVVESEIEKIAKIIKSDDYAFIKIFGYASTTGDSIYNMELSKKRAYSVYNRINQISKIDDDRFYMTWIGESPDDYDLHYENSHPQSRCVDILIQTEK